MRLPLFRGAGNGAVSADGPAPAVRLPLFRGAGNGAASDNGPHPTCGLRGFAVACGSVGAGRAVPRAP
ncbi:hypothetical protein GCM10010372_77710 [Streptomyces tauricus]|nr:hypothetical protein GCM10010372_77710 [Streptomyces tauricus]